MNKKLLITLLSLLIHTAAFTQELRLSVYNEALSGVLQKLQVEVSFDSRALAAYRISVDKNFKSPQKAIDYLLKDKPFMCECINGVYVISPKKEKQTTTNEFIKNEYLITGYIVDAETVEKLPNAYIQTKNNTIASDENGIFTIKQNDNEPISISVDYLGYMPLDTVLSYGKHSLKLIPRSITLEPVVINSPPATMMMQTGNISGETRINHHIARFMPGSIDNSVFNLLRMMPGVRASGEPSDELIVWGSLGGESRISFDGFLLYGMKSFNENISSVNPYMVKDIRLLKGGYDASVGNQAGSLAKITGIDGRKGEPSVKANVSNLTANIFGSVPIHTNASLLAAYRQTFYNLYESQLLNPFNGKRSASANGKGKGNRMTENTTETYLFPDYGFRDFNLKYASDVPNGSSYYISLYGASDKFDFSLKNEDASEINASQESRQYAATSHYNRVWDNRMSTKIVLSYSQLNTDEDHISIPVSGQAASSMHVDNLIQEFLFELSHNFILNKRQKIKIGTELIQYTNRLNGIQDDLFKPTVYAVDDLTMDKLSLTGSLRADFVLSDIFIQPRISVGYSFSENLKATASWGIYKQYMARNPIVDDLNTVSFVWKIADKSLKARHTLAGLAYSNNGLLVSVEGYNKYTCNAVRFYKNEIYTTNVDIWGADIFLKKEFGKSSLFGSYSLTDISEKNTETGHEIKLGGILSLSPFYISSNYVYGTGFSTVTMGKQGMGQENKTPDVNKDYSRFDIAATYRLDHKKWTLQTGLSLINIFNTQNIKYDYSLAGEKEVVNVYTQAMPFTPMLFVEILF